METHYSYKDLSYGVLLTSPEGQNRFLLGEDAKQFLFEVRQLNKLWESGNTNPQLFTKYEDLLDNHHEIYFF